MRRTALQSLKQVPKSTARTLVQKTSVPARNFASVIESSKDPTELDEITTLPNGVRVATESLPGPFSGIGVYVDAGSRYESADLQGVSHIIDRLAFKSTKSRSADQMFDALEALGGNIQCSSSRESLMYQSASFNSAIPTTLGLLAETIREPLITEEEVKDQLETADYEIGEIWAKPDLILPELVHVAAYKDNTLGNPLLCPKERLDKIDKAVVDRYRSIFFKPERLVVAFAGVSHEEALKLTERYFGDMQKDTPPILSVPETSNIPTTPADGLPEASSSSSSSSTTSASSSSSASSSTSHGSSSSSASTHHQNGLLNKIPFFKNLSTSAPKNATVLPDLPYDPLTLNLHAPSHYTGGFLSLPPIPPPLNPTIPALTHIHLAFEAFPISSPDIYALATLQTLLGGGGSFSAGGPGKGMYSRLYTNVLNQHGWVESAVAFNNAYTDSGLFGIAASCAPDHIMHMLDVMCRELQSLTLDTGFSALREDEVLRAKNQLRSSLLMNLESRMVELEDLGRQVQVHGRKVGVREMCTQIENVTVGDLRRVARLVLGGEVRNLGGGSGAPTVVLQEGEVSGGRRRKLGWEEIQERISRWKLGRR
ncbi:MAG: Mitochondrial-processing peptidase subunit alpha [Cirrosporium novae-zelandiae]|nr:MAG: Mitochondrial-processing peptidase subunit alpha [Cirrosporium novae-zelandiae]